MTDNYELPSVVLSDGAGFDRAGLDRFAQRLQDEIAKRQALTPIPDSGIHPDVAWGAAAADEWLVVECEAPGCKAGTTVDVPAADPTQDTPPVRAVLDDRGWSLDAQGRDLCPQHSSA